MSSINTIKVADGIKFELIKGTFKTVNEMIDQLEKVDETVNGVDPYTLKAIKYPSRFNCQCK